MPASGPSRLVAAASSVRVPGADTQFMRTHDETRWLAGFSTYRHFVETNGHGRVPVRYVTGDGFALGKWVANQKDLHRRGALIGRRVALLESDDSWAWKANEDSWTAGHDRLRRFVHAHGRLPHLEEEWDGWQVGAWMRTQRRAQMEGRLCMDRRDALLAIPMWSWNSGEPQPTHPEGPGSNPRDRHSS